MLNAQRWGVAIRLFGAGVLCLLLLAITLPNLGHAVLPDGSRGYSWRDGMAIALIVAPFLFVVIGAGWSRLIECMGWAVLLLLLVLRFFIR